MRALLLVAALALCSAPLRAELAVDADDPETPAAPAKSAVAPPAAPKETRPIPPIPPATRATRDAVSRLIRGFAAEAWRDRENASEAIAAFDETALPQLLAAYEHSSDPEVRARAMLAIVAIREGEISGTYVQTGSETTDGAGNHRDGDSRAGWLVIGGGKAVWNQRFDATVTSQTYTFDISERIAVGQKLEMRLTFEDLETVIGYSAESHDPKLVFSRLQDGRIRVTFIGTDGMNQTSKVEFAPRNANPK